MKTGLRSARWILLSLACLGAVAQTFNSRVRLVDVYASVYDGAGKAVDGLAQERFQVLDNGKPQQLFSFESVSGDVTCAILLDTTGSMRDSLASLRNGVGGLLDEMRPDDSVAIYTFSTALDRIQDFTTDKAAAKRAVQRLRAGGATALYDAVAEVAEELSEKKGKKALVLFTDGADNSSRLLARAAADRALKAGVTVYTIAEGDALHESKLLGQLQGLADQTGGLCYKPHSPKEVAKVFVEIQAELKHVYMLSYKPPSDADEAKWRTIQVQVKGGNFRIRGKQGYYPN